MMANHFTPAPPPKQKEEPKEKVKETVKEKIKEEVKEDIKEEIQEETNDSSKEALIFDQNGKVTEIELNVSDELSETTV